MVPLFIFSNKIVKRLFRILAIRGKCETCLTYYVDIQFTGITNYVLIWTKLQTTLKFNIGTGRRSSKKVVLVSNHSSWRDLEDIHRQILEIIYTLNVFLSSGGKRSLQYI